MKTVYTQESSWKVAANASGYVYYIQGKRVGWIFTGKQRQRKDNHLVILSLSQFICTATGLLLLQ